jgi:hypothetical protein
MTIARAYRSPNPSIPRYSRKSELPSSPTSCPEFDAALARLDEVRGDLFEISGKLTKTEQAIRSADQTYAFEASAAKREGRRVPTDPREALSKKREKLVVEKQVAVQVMNDLADELDAIVDDHREAWRKREKDLRAERLERAEATRLQLEQELQAVAERTALISWLGGGKLHGSPIGSKELNALAKAIDQALAPTTKPHVTSDQLARLQRGAEAVDVNGNTIPAGTKPSQVKLTHTPHGRLLESPLGKAGDYA